MVHRALSWLVYLPLGVGLSLAHGALFWTAHSERGHAFAAAGLAVGVGAILVGWRSERHGARLRLAGLVAAVIGIVGLVGVIAAAPSGRSVDTARVQNRYVGDAWNYRRFALGNMVPELDQFRLGFSVMSRVDPLFDAAQADRLRVWTTSIYEELEADPEFAALGSAMPHAYENLRGGPAWAGHYFLYVPERLTKTEPQPALVFLHGSGGNFKAYTWLLAKVAERVGCVVVAPSFGMGDWRSPESAAVVAAVLSDVERVVTLDAHRTHLMGLSNGGLGVSQVAAAAGDRFSSLVFLSPVFDAGELSSAAFRTKWRGRDILVMTGTTDNRTPIDYVSDEARGMRANGASVALVGFEGADHFLFFSHAEAVQARLEAWLGARMANDNRANASKDAVESLARE